MKASKAKEIVKTVLDKRAEYERQAPQRDLECILAQIKFFAEHGITEYNTDDFLPSTVEKLKTLGYEVKVGFTLPKSFFSVIKNTLTVRW